MRFGIKGRNILRNGLDEVGLADMGQGVVAQHGDGRGAVGGSHAGDAGAGDDHRFGIGLRLGNLLRQGGGGDRRKNHKRRPDKQRRFDFRTCRHKEAPGCFAFAKLVWFLPPFPL